MPLYFEDLPAIGIRIRRACSSRWRRATCCCAIDGDGTFEDTTEKSERQSAGLVLGRVLRRFRQRRLAGYLRRRWLGVQRQGHRDRARLPEQRRQQAEAFTRPGIFFDPKYFGTASWHGWERNRYLRNERRRHLHRDGPRGGNGSDDQQPRRGGGGFLESRRAGHRGVGFDRQTRAAARTKSDRKRNWLASGTGGRRSRTGMRWARGSPSM